MKQTSILIIFFLKIVIPILTGILIFKNSNDWAQYGLAGVFSFLFISSLSLQGQYSEYFPAVKVEPNNFLKIVNLKNVILFAAVGGIFYTSDNLKNAIYLSISVFLLLTVLWHFLSKKHRQEVMENLKAGKTE